MQSKGNFNVEIGNSDSFAMMLLMIHEKGMVLGITWTYLDHMAEIGHVSKLHVMFIEENHPIKHVRVLLI